MLNSEDRKYIVNKLHKGWWLSQKIKNMIWLLLAESEDSETNRLNEKIKILEEKLKATINQDNIALTKLQQELDTLHITNKFYEDQRIELRAKLEELALFYGDSQKEDKNVPEVSDK